MPTRIRADDGDSIFVEACPIMEHHAVVMIQVENVVHEDGSDWITLSAGNARELAYALLRAATSAEILSASEGNAIAKITLQGRRLDS